MRQWILTALALSAAVQVNCHDSKTTRGFEARYILDRLGVKDETLHPRIAYTQIPNRPKYKKIFIETDTLHCTVTLRMIIGMFPLVNEEAKKTLKCVPILVNDDNVTSVEDPSKDKNGTQQADLIKLQKTLDRKRAILSRKIRKLSQLEEKLAGDVDELLEKNFNTVQLRQNLNEKRQYLSKKQAMLKLIEEQLVHMEDQLDQKKTEVAHEEDELGEIEGKIRKIQELEAKIKTDSKIQSSEIDGNTTKQDLKDPVKSTNTPIYDQLFVSEVVKPQVGGNHKQAKSSPKKEKEEKMRTKQIILPSVNEEENPGQELPTESKSKDKVAQDNTKKGGIENSLVKKMVDKVHSILINSDKNINPIENTTENRDIKGSLTEKSNEHVHVTKSRNQTKGWTVVKAEEPPTLLLDDSDPGLGSLQPNKGIFDDNSEVTPFEPFEPEPKDNEKPKRVQIYNSSTMVDPPLKDEHNNRFNRKHKDLPMDGKNGNPIESTTRNGDTEGNLGETEEDTHVSRSVTKNGTTLFKGATKTVEGDTAPFRQDYNNIKLVQNKMTINGDKDGGSIPDYNRLNKLVHQLKDVVRELDELVHTPKGQMNASVTNTTSSPIKNTTEGKGVQELNKIQTRIAKFITKMWPLRRLFGSTQEPSREKKLSQDKDENEENSINYHTVGKLETQLNTAKGEMNTKVKSKEEQFTDRVIKEKQLHVAPRDSKTTMVVYNSKDPSITLTLPTPAVITEDKEPLKLLSKDHIKDKMKMTLVEKIVKLVNTLQPQQKMRVNFWEKQPTTFTSKDNTKDKKPTTLPSAENIKENQPTTPSSKKNIKDKQPDTLQSTEDIKDKKAETLPAKDNFEDKQKKSQPRPVVHHFKEKIEDKVPETPSKDSMKNEQPVALPSKDDNSDKFPIKLPPKSKTKDEQPLINSEKKAKLVSPLQPKNHITAHILVPSSNSTAELGGGINYVPIDVLANSVNNTLEENLKKLPDLPSAESPHVVNHVINTTTKANVKRSLANSSHNAGKNEHSLVENGSGRSDAVLNVMINLGNLATKLSSKVNSKDNATSQAKDHSKKLQETLARGDIDLVKTASTTKAKQSSDPNSINIPSVTDGVSTSDNVEEDSVKDNNAVGSTSHGKERIPKRGKEGEVVQKTHIKNSMSSPVTKKAARGLNGQLQEIYNTVVDQLIAKIPSKDVVQDQVTKTLKNLVNKGKEKWKDLQGKISGSRKLSAKAFHHKSKQRSLHKSYSKRKNNKKVVNKQNKARRRLQERPMSLLKPRESKVKKERALVSPAASKTITDAES